MDFVFCAYGDSIEACEKFGCGALTYYIRTVQFSKCWEPPMYVLVACCLGLLLLLSWLGFVGLFCLGFFLCVCVSFVLFGFVVFCLGFFERWYL